MGAAFSGRSSGYPDSESNKQEIGVYPENNGRLFIWIT